jgi:hypothetical protein
MDFAVAMIGRIQIAGWLLLLGAVAPSMAAGGVTVAPLPCPPALGMNGEEISQRLAAMNARRAHDLKSFEGQRQYALDYVGFPSSRSAEMTVKVSYRAPGSKDFTVVSETGSKLIVNRVFHKLLESEQESSRDAKSRAEVALTAENYQFALRGCAVAGGRDLYVMEVEPRRDTKFLYRGTIWIDAQDFAVTRIEAEPAKNPSFWIRKSQILHQYRKVGEFYLPALNQTVTDVRLGGKAVLTILYEDYKLGDSESGEGGGD